ncbi:MAG TPA: hypothetical protein VFO66_08875 [Gemmatimonadaceae bacterium]|nr:hypothetical protein [Gemmatimonadaceae bacterium]
MSYRRVFILGGAALVLAACADSTAPSTQMHRAGASSAVRDSTTKAGPTTRTMETMTTEECRTGVQVTSGRTDSTCIVEGGM